MSEQELDLAYMAAKIEKLEQEQSVFKQHLLKLKHLFDNLKEEFKNQPELQKWETLQR